MIDVPNTGCGPGSGSGGSELWLHVALLAVTSFGILGFHVRQRH